MEKKITIGNVCFIQDKLKESVLLLKRCRDPLKNLYTGVGGKAHFDEDIHNSCLREVKEETGLIVSDLKCRGILKTLLDKADSSWILFVYTAECFTGQLIECNEGKLEWVPYHKLTTLPLIGFIQEVLPQILFEEQFVEGTLRHDARGHVLEKRLRSRLCTFFEPETVSMSDFKSSDTVSGSKNAQSRGSILPNKLNLNMIQNARYLP